MEPRACLLRGPGRTVLTQAWDCMSTSQHDLSSRARSPLVSSVVAVCACPPCPSLGPWTPALDASVVFHLDSGLPRTQTLGLGVLCRIECRAQLPMSQQPQGVTHPTGLRPREPGLCQNLQSQRVLRAGIAHVWTHTCTPSHILALPSRKHPHVRRARRPHHVLSKCRPVNRLLSSGEGG